MTVHLAYVGNHHSPDTPPDTLFLRYHFQMHFSDRPLLDSSYSRQRTVRSAYERFHLHEWFVTVEHTPKTLSRSDGLPPPNNWVELRLEISILHATCRLSIRVKNLLSAAVHHHHDGHFAECIFGRFFPNHIASFGFAPQVAARYSYGVLFLQCPVARKVGSALFLLFQNSCPFRMPSSRASAPIASMEYDFSQCRISSHPRRISHAAPRQVSSKRKI